MPPLAAEGHQLEGVGIVDVGSAHVHLGGDLVFVGSIFGFQTTTVR
jgi:hypothetical protein